LRERTLELKLVKETRKRGGVALKFVSPSFAGMPDRLVLLPHQVMGFVEVKAPGERPRPLQQSRHALLRRMGFPVFVLADPGRIPEILDTIARTRDEEEGEDG